MYAKAFAVNLCDNGSEFATFYDIELNDDGKQIVKTFFTNPYRATDKSHCERNHEFIRYVIPKHTTLDRLTQHEVDELFSNINSYVRKALKNKTPYDLMVKKYGQKFVDDLNIIKIENKKVKLRKI